MVSIIICSRSSKISKSLQENIEATIGAPYELVVINNSSNSYSIFQAYNLGIKQSKGDYWCFIHDDLLFETENWGVALEHIFKTNPQVGLVGVAGAKVKTKMPSAWWDCPHELMVTNISHQLSDGTFENQYHGFNLQSLVEVVVIDGVFMAGRAHNNVVFSNNLEGFHGYDVDISLKYKKIGFKVMVTNQVLLKHFSVGHVNKKWVEAQLKLYSIYKTLLPISVKNTISNKQLVNLELENGINFCNKLKKYGFKIKALKFWLKTIRVKPKSKWHLKFIKSWL